MLPELMISTEASNGELIKNSRNLGSDPKSGNTSASSACGSIKPSDTLLVNFCNILSVGNKFDLVKNHTRSTDVDLLFN